MRRIKDFTEIKAFVDVFNEHGHKGFKKPINPFYWWADDGQIDKDVHAFFDDGLVVVLETQGHEVKNLLLFALYPQKNIMRKILDIVKDYDTIVFNSEYGDRYKSITRRFDGSCSFSNGRYYYTADGGRAWELSKSQ